ncbi:hypothetical protein [Peribacillus glennii]|uniref:hypothetical protein n=1 Tax=Peribacillus glennii TaxID=2303991 RepID=UPI001313E298|nr:hypothetical protein [Peribacillus glennii]
MNKWGISAILYLLLVIGGYTVYSEVFQNNKDKSAEAKNAGHGHESGAKKD